MASVGDIIGSYRLVEELDCGTFGCVYQGEHIIFSDDPVVAIKLLHVHLGAQKERDRFIQEARILKKLTHPHILPIFGAGIHEGSLYLTVEYAPNGSLKDRLKSGKSLLVEEAVSILAQIGAALQYAHEQNIIHRDLKPANILFNARNDEVLLADFGIAVVSEKTQRIDNSGTPAYMAPEQFDGIISKKSDQ
jgi:serine/threonine protein kinase